MSGKSVQFGERGGARARVIIAILVLCFATVCFFRVGHWLVREDALQKSAAIVVLSGGMPERALEAADEYRSGYAPEVWITQPEQPKRAMQTLGVPFDGEEEYSRRVLIHEGVPPNAIRIVSPTIANTADEMNVIAGSLKRVNGSAVIVVTSRAHTRRVHALWNRIEGERGHIVVRAAASDSFDPAYWWRSTHDALEVVREVLGLLNVLAGLPVKPTR